MNSAKGFSGYCFDAKKIYWRAAIAPLLLLAASLQTIETEKQQKSQP